MTTEELNEAFEEAVNKVNSYTDPSGRFVIAIVCLL